MPVLRGSITFSRFRVESQGDRPADVKRWLARGFRAHAFEPLDRASDEDVASGWVEVEDPDQVELSPSRLVFGEYVLVGYRIDRLRVPSAQVKSELDKWTRIFEESNKRVPKKGERSEQRDEIVARLRKRAFPVTRVHDVSWNLATDQLQIWSTSRNVVDQIEAALEKHFHLRLHALAPGAYSSLLRLPPEAEAKLRAELDAGQVRFDIEHYEAKHGYAVDDSDVYDQAAAERHYAALEKLFRETLHA